MTNAKSDGGPRAGRPAADDRPDGGPDAVTTGLKRLFAAIEDEPIPDDFLRLLDAIDERRDTGNGDAVGGGRKVGR